MAWSRSRSGRAAPDPSAGEVDDAMAARIDRDLRELE
jgi:hypothetical protein